MCIIIYQLESYRIWPIYSWILSHSWAKIHYQLIVHLSPFSWANQQCRHNYWPVVEPIEKADTTTGPQSSQSTSLTQPPRSITLHYRLDKRNYKLRSAKTNWDFFLLFAEDLLSVFQVRPAGHEVRLTPDPYPAPSEPDTVLRRATVALQQLDHEELVVVVTEVRLQQQQQ